MNYSTYFNNKVAANLSNKFNLLIVETEAGTHNEFLKSDQLFDSMKELNAVLDTIDAYAVIMADNIITAKVMRYEEQKA